MEVSIVGGWKEGKQGGERDATMPEIADLMVRIAGNDRGSNDAVRIQLAD